LSGTAGAALSIRISPETRGALEAEAAKSGKKLSTVVVKMIEDGLSDRRYRDSVSKPIRALATLVEDIENTSRAPTADGRVCEWSSDPTVFEAFRIAVAKLLEKLRPPGDIDTSIDGPLVGRSPEHQAEFIIRAVWSNLLGAVPVTPTQGAALRDQYAHEQLAGGGPTHEELVEISSYTYRMAGVRKALNIKQEEGK
jgi:hypothetical protein